MGPCADCGGEGRYLLTEDGAQRPVCPDCLERATGRLGLARLMEGMRHPRHAADRCPHCGTTREDLAKTGLAGCPLCYEAFPADTFIPFGIRSA